MCTRLRPMRRCSPAPKQRPSCARKSSRTSTLPLDCPVKLQTQKSILRICQMRRLPPTRLPHRQPQSLRAPSAQSPRLSRTMQRRIPRQSKRARRARPIRETLNGLLRQMPLLQRREFSPSSIGGHHHSHALQCPAERAESLGRWQACRRSSSWLPLDVQVDTVQRLIQALA